MYTITGFYTDVYDMMHRITTAILRCWLN